MAEGVEIYSNEAGDKIKLNKIYSRVDVQYKAQFELCDKYGNSIKRSFPWINIADTWGKKKLKTAFLGKGLKPLADDDIDELYRGFLNVQSDIDVTVVGKSSTTTLLSMKKQLEEWYNQSLDEENGLKRMILTLEDGTRYDVIYEATLEENDDLTLNDGKYIKNNVVYDKNDKLIEALNETIIKKGTIQGDNVLLISCPVFKKWLAFTGYQPNPFINKLVQVGVLYTPNISAYPRYLDSTSKKWYRAIYIDKLYLMDLIV